MPEYAHGHHQSVLKAHKWRTVANSLEFLVPYVKPHFHVLDVGCGPGSISIDMAKNYVPDGKVIGIEPTQEPLNVAAEDAKHLGVANIKFCIGDAANLKYADNTFDLVYVHQVLQYLPNPVAVLEELKRVTKPGGIVALKEADMGTLAMYPESQDLSAYVDLWGKLIEINGGFAHGGRRLRAWAADAGYRNMIHDSSTWYIADPEHTALWGSTHADRILLSHFGESAKSKKLVSQQDLEKMAKAWRNWGVQEYAMLSMTHFQVLYIVE